MEQTELSDKFTSESVCWRLVLFNPHVEVGITILSGAIAKSKRKRFSDFS